MVCLCISPPSPSRFLRHVPWTAPLLGRTRKSRTGRALASTAAVLLGLCLVAGPSAAQPDPDSSGVPAAVDPDELLDEVDPDVGSEELVRQVLDRIGDPVDLQSASAADLAELPVLSPLLARRIVAHRARQGAFRSVNDLLAVPGVDAELLARIRPFVTVRLPPTGGAAPTTGRPRWPLRIDITQQMSRRLDLGRGYSGDTTRTRFLGSPERLLTRVRGRAGDRLRFGAVLDKDPGEPVAWEPAQGMYGADHVSATVSLHDAGPLTQLVAGDYAVAFGQGVAFGRSATFGKGRNPAALLRSGRGLRPWSTTDENQFFRGVGATITPIPFLAVSGWFSRKRRDASSGDPSLRTAGSALPITSLSSDGYHRTPSERARKNAVRERIAGAALTVERPRWTVGVAAAETRYHRPLRPDPAPERRYEPRGATFATVTAFGAAYPGDVHLFAEVTRTGPDVWGGVAGLSANRRYSSALLFGRWYPPAFWSLHGAALGEQSGRPRNERGVYAGVRLQVAPRWTLTAYTDVYWFPWLRFRVPRPSAGIDARLVVTHRPRPWLRHTADLRAETRGIGLDRAASNGTVVDDTGRETRRSIRWNATFDFSSALRLRTRLEAVRVVHASSFGPDRTAETGVLMAQDLRWKPRQGVTTETRLALFETDGFASRVFAYEYDVRGSFSVPAFQDRGERFYVLLRADVRDAWTVEAKYAVTSLRGTDSIGSGLDEVTGDRLREVRLQVRVRIGS